MALGQVRRIVAAKRAADQQRPAELGQACFELGDGLTRMMVQRGDPQAFGHAQFLQRSGQLAGLLRDR